MSLELYENRVVHVELSTSWKEYQIPCSFSIPLRYSLYNGIHTSYTRGMKRRMKSSTYVVSKHDLSKTMNETRQVLEYNECHI